jgi:cytoskeletal protein RodZ
MDFLKLGEGIREWLLAQQWLSLAHDWLAKAPAWQILGALSAPIVILLVALVLLVLALGSRAKDGSSETRDTLAPAESKVEQANAEKAAVSPSSISSTEPNAVVAKITPEPGPSIPGPEVESTASATEPSPVVAEVIMEPVPATAHEADAAVGSTEHAAAFAESEKEPSPSTSA